MILRQKHTRLTSTDVSKIVWGIIAVALLSIGGYILFVM